MLRLNRAVLAAFLCSATAPAATCDLTPQMSPFNAGQVTTLEDTGVTISRAMVAPNTSRPDGIQLPNATVNALPVTSTAPDHEPESGLR